MAAVSVREAERDFSHLIDRVLDGEDFVVEAGTKPKVRIVPVETDVPKRVPGRWKGMFEVDDAAFAPLTDEGLRDWGL